MCRYDGRASDSDDEHPPGAAAAAHLHRAGHPAEHPGGGAAGRGAHLPGHRAHPLRPSAAQRDRLIQPFYWGFFFFFSITVFIYNFTNVKCQNTL